MKDPHTDITFDREPQEVIAEILSRYSVLDLHEQSDADLERGELKIKGFEIKILNKGETNFIKWWKINSAGNEYEVRRFENFVFCSCLDFFFTKKVCKHIFCTTKSFNDYEHRQMDKAPYLKTTSTRKPETLGGVRF